MKIIQVGAYPPPFGGVSSHLQRLTQYLASRGKDWLLIDLSGVENKPVGVVNMTMRQALWFLIKQPRSIIHFHNFSLENTCYYYMLSFRHVILLSFHNEWFIKEISAKGEILKRVGIFILNRLDYIIVDNQKCKEMALQIFPKKDRIKLIHEFIAPQCIPDIDHDQIVSLRKCHRFLLASNAFQIDFHEGQDLYGLDLLVGLLERLVHAHGLDVALVFLLPRVGNQAYFEKIKAELRERGLEERFLFVTEPLEEASSLWKISDVVIRATNTDGSSLSVLETLTLSVPVVASDCVDRPEGVVLFKTRDIDDLCGKVLHVLSSLEDYRRALKDRTIENNAEKFLDLYEKIEKEQVSWI